LALLRVDICAPHFARTRAMRSSPIEKLGRIFKSLCYVSDTRDFSRDQTVSISMKLPKREFGGTSRNWSTEARLWEEVTRKRSETLLQLGEPYSPAKAIQIFFAVIHDRESLFFEQSSILVGVQTRVVQRLAFQLSDDFTLHGSGCKHQCGSK
jgi:hypothetical protein